MSLYKRHALYKTISSWKTKKNWDIRKSKTSIRLYDRESFTYCRLNNLNCSKTYMQRFEKA